MISFSNAKINIGLNVVEKRPDGYHNLETVFYPIPVKDALEILIQPEQKEEYKLFNSGIEVDSAPENNICIKALLLLKQEYTIPPVEIHLHKAIPFGAGLGGGSADGAFALTMINELCHLNVPVEKLLSMAKQLGADCPFFITNKPAFATGIGDQLSHVAIDLSNYYLVLVKPPIHVSTPEAYSGVVAQPSENNLSHDIHLPVEEWKDRIKNDFEKSVLGKYPEIENIKNQLYDEGAVYAAMSGSGSTVFGLFKTPVDLFFDQSYYVWSGFLRDK